MVEITRRGVLGGAAGVAVSAIGSQAAASAGSRVHGEAAVREEPLRPVRLTTEHLFDPLGIDDPRPRLGWQFKASGENRAQTAYQIIVASRRELVDQDRPDVWDSGRVESAEQTARVYRGPALRSRTRYFWGVRAWDESGREGPMSDAAWFETAMLEGASEWGASRWIGSGLVLQKPVKVLYSERLEPIDLAPGRTLGQSFASTSPLAGLGILVGVETGDAETAGFTMTLRRSGPSGEVVHRQVVEGLTPDRYGMDQGRMTLPEAVPPGKLYLELSDPVGTVKWLTSLRKDAYPDGEAFEDGKGVDGARTLDGIPPDPPANPLLRKEFAAPGRVTRARLYLAGVGHAAAWVNGTRVGDHELTPAATDYDTRILYTTYDVTRLLRRGANAVGIALGRGFYATRAPESDGSHLARWIAEPRVRARLEVETSEGSFAVDTDDSWRWAPGPWVYDSVFTGETYDAGVERRLTGWDGPSYDDSGWERVALVEDPGGRLEAYSCEPIRAVRIVQPVKVSRPAKGVLQYDFGAVLSGTARLRGRFPAGTRIRLQHGEKLDSAGRVYTGVPGGFDNVSINGRLQRDEYVASGRGVEEWRASFTYKGFRYVEVSGPARLDAERVDLEAVTLHTDIADTMDLRIEQPELQWIADAFAQTTRNAVHGHPDVSPMAKGGWTGANHWAAQPMLYRFGMASAYAKWLDDIRLLQAPSGEIPVIAPMGHGGQLTPTSTAAYPYLVRRYWLTYGDATIPARHFDAVRRYLDYLQTTLEDGIGDDAYGDWYPPNPVPSPAGPEGGRLVGTAYIVQSLRDGVALATLLGHQETAAEWQGRIDAMIRRFNAEFLDRTAGVYRTERTAAGYRQTSNAVPLAFGFVPSSVRDRVLRNLVADIEKRERHLNTGNIGTAVLPFALAEHGRSDLAVAVLTQKDYPSYGYLRSLGATTFWESWEAESRAHNDPTLSGPVRWLVEGVLGVSVLEPGWARFRVAPVAVSEVPGARAVFETPRGRVRVAWRRHGERLVVDVRVPVNAVAEVVLPDGTRHEFGSGAHRVETRRSRT